MNNSHFSEETQSNPPPLPCTASRFQNLHAVVYPALLLAQLVLFLSLALWAGQWGLSGLHTYPALFVLDRWEDTRDTQAQTGRAPKEETWFAAMGALAKARQLAPNHADTLVMLGRMHHHKALTQTPWSNAAQFHRRQAIASYQRALELRPAWGYAWILLAQVRVQNGESTADAIVALMRAITLASWSSEVQKTGVQLGFALWPLLNASQQEAIRTLAEKAFPRYGDVLLKQATQYKQLKLIQPFLEKNPQWQ